MPSDLQLLSATQLASSEVLASSIEAGVWGASTATSLELLESAIQATSEGDEALSFLIQHHTDAFLRGDATAQAEFRKAIAGFIRSEPETLKKALTVLQIQWLGRNRFAPPHFQPTFLAHQLSTRVFLNEDTGPQKAPGAEQGKVILTPGEINRHLFVAAAGGDKTIPPLVENGGPEEVSMIEETKTPPQEFLTLVEREVQRIKDHYLTLKDSLEPPVQGEYEKELGLIAKRVTFWQGAIEDLPSQHGKERRRYAEDILLGERILLDRVLNLGTKIFSEPLPEDALSRVGLRTGIGIPIPILRPPIERKPSGKILPALVNHEVRYGRSLRLRPHQIMALNRIRGLLKMREAQLKEDKELPEELMRGTIVMPVGGGKTRTMVAGFAAAIETGAFQKGDKLIILNHTEQIHGQNLKVVRLLNGYFHRMFGRNLRITEYKADRKNLRGDVVVVSIPSINTKERREQFEAELRRGLGERGQVVMVAVDEIHHLELSGQKSKESWREAIQTIRRISPNVYRIGFTATPTGKEGPYILRLRETDLMRSGVTPRTYLVKVDGVDLTQLKVSEHAQDFQTRELVSVLLNHPERNERVFQTLEAQGLKRENKSLNGKERLEATLVFAADLKHARMMAKGYREYFGREGGSLKGRQFILLGEERGKIKEKELSKAIADYQSGKMDAIVAIVSGETKKEIRNQILEAVAKGAIEVVFNVDVWFEGADLWMFTHQIGARPTFSRFKKGQEKGRLNRRGPQEVTSQGVLRSDKPKILFDVVDRYHSMERHLMRYGELMGVKEYTAAKPGELFDAMAEKVVTEVDPTGKAVEHRDIEKLILEYDKLAKPSQEILLKPLMTKLWGILETQYGNDVAAMAQDLGLPVEDMREILEGRGWINARWFLRRIATLLYQDREVLVDVYNDERELVDERVSDADIKILKSALAVYYDWEGFKGGEITIRGDLGYGEETIRVAPALLVNLEEGTLGELQWRRLWRGLTIYFGLKVSQEAQEWFENLVDHLFKRESWTRKTETAPERLLLKAREVVALKFGGRLPAYPDIEGVPDQHGQNPLTRWLAGKKIDFSPRLPSSEFYSQVKALLTGLGVSQKEAQILIVDAVFEERGWDRKQDTAQERLLFKAREVVALKFGGRLPNQPNIEGISMQGNSRLLTRWLAGKKIVFSSNLSPLEFYRQVKALLTGLGVSPEKAEGLIVDAVFEERSWDRKQDTAQERLLFKAREVMALKFGGRLPNRPNIEGVSIQHDHSSLTRWLAGESVRLTPSLSSQIRALLRYGNHTTPAEADRLITPVKTQFNPLENKK